MTDEQKKLSRAESNKRWLKKHPEVAAENNRRWRKNNPEKYKANKKRWRDNARLLRPEAYKAYITKRNRGQINRIRRNKFGTDGKDLYTEQNGMCKICLRTMILHGGSSMLAAQLDHDHNTEQVRGWLCRACNLAIGLLGDDIERIARAIEYIRSHGCLPVNNVSNVL